jgi:hypothetical protein
MPQKWLQVRGDPSVRAFLFAQERIESQFDVHLDKMHCIVRELLRSKGVFHAKIHYSSSQLTLWFSDDAYRYRVYLAEEVLAPTFLDQFHAQSLAHLKPTLGEHDVAAILAEFKRLRLSDQTIYLRNGSINLINGMIGMTFSCDGAHYIDHKTFFERLESFGTPSAADSLSDTVGYG